MLLLPLEEAGNLSKGLGVSIKDPQKFVPIALYNHSMLKRQVALGQAEMTPSLSEGVAVAWPLSAEPTEEEDALFPFSCIYLKVVVGTPLCVSGPAMACRCPSLCAVYMNPVKYRHS